MADDKPEDAGLAPESGRAKRTPPTIDLEATEVSTQPQDVAGELEAQPTAEQAKSEQPSVEEAKFEEARFEEAKAEPERAEAQGAAAPAAVSPWVAGPFSA